MTKKKKGMSVQTKVQPKMPNGRVTKAKHRDLPPLTPSTRKLQVKLHKSPFILQQSPVLAKDGPMTTPFLKKCLPNTSTPLNAGGESCENNNLRDFNSKRRQILKYTDDARSRTPLSPILGDISNVISTNASRKTNMSLRRNARSVGNQLEENTKRDRKENVIEPSSPVRKIIKPNEELGVIDSGKQLNNTKRKLSTRRKSVGVRRVSLAPVTDEMQQESNKPDTNSRKTVVYKSPINTKSNCRRRSPEAVPDQSLIKRLRQDWSSTTFGETPAQLLRIRSEKNPQLISKRILSPLIEVSTYESTLPAFKQQTVPVIEEEEREYSSSAEFESDDDKENSRSKRAPTWKDLSKKTLKQPLSHTTRRSRVKIHRLPNDYMEPKSMLNEADLSVSMDRSSIVPQTNQNKKEESSKSLAKMPSQETTQQIVETNHDSPNKSLAEETIPTLSRSANLLNKSDLIEELLSSSAERDNETAIPSITKMNSTKKFYHSRVENKSVSVQNIEKPKIDRPSRKSEKPNTVYEFLSQSSQSDTNDPVADIIQKMISTGKVTVAKHKKGTGKLVVPRRRRKAATNTNLPKANNVLAKPKVIAKPKLKSPQENLVEDASPFDIDFHDGDDIAAEEPARDQRGFSDLARSAMMKQARHNKTTHERKMITDKKQLLAMAQKFVAQSTPVRSLTSPNAQLSPIVHGGSTPWRVNNDKLPQTFYFSRNSANLPSFSSDYIPLTPSKNKSKSTSSFSSNDSNGENIAPPKVNGQHSNPRRALSYRSPLKAINILDIVSLPTLVMDNNRQKDTDTGGSKENATTNKSRRSNNSEKSINEPISNTNMHGFDDTIDNLGDRDEIKEQSKSVGALTNSNMFGFDEMIEADEDDLVIESTDQLALTGKHHIKEQMQRLRRLRDKIPSPVVKPATSNQIKSVFDGDKQQKTIKQMLCSTMIEKDSCGGEKGGTLNKKAHLNETDCSELFKDPDPETTFDQSAARRSYTRPFQRKRKLRHNFVMFMDSDASEDEEEIPAAKQYKKKTKDRQRKVKENAELKNFVNEFNEMCKEVSEYELIVE